ncbi:MAG: xanthine dehydrogenase FAD-binding subunit XdhB [Oscillospiraceae bacterium]
MYDICRTLKATDVAEALRLFTQYPEAVPVAGGTDVLIHMKERKLREATLLSLRDIQELQGIRREEDGTLVIGAGTCFAAIVRNPMLQELVPVLCKACNQVGSPQIRNVATIGGNLCNGAVSADSAPSLLVLEAVLQLESAAGTRLVPLTEFYSGPGKTVLQKGKELLIAIRIPRSGYEGRGAACVKFGQRSAMEIATLGCAASVALEQDKKTVRELRLAFGVAAPTPVRCPQTEALLTGKPADADWYRMLRRSLLEELSPRESWRASKELREQLIRELSTRTVAEAIENAGGNHND